MVSKKIFQNPVSEGGIALIKGPYEEVIKQSKDLLSEVPPEDCLIIDASELISILNINRYAETQSSNVFAPITAFQLRQFVNEELEKTIKESNCNIVIISSMRNLFFDPNLNDNEYSKVFSEILTKIREISAKHSVFVVALDFTEVYGNGRDNSLNELLEIASDWIIQPNSSEVSLLEVEKCVKA